jgi:hypothetical protein
MGETAQRAPGGDNARQPNDAATGLSGGSVIPDRWQVLQWLSLALAGLIGMAQIGVIVQEVVPTGALSVTTLYAPGQVLSSFAPTSDALNTWAVASRQFGVLWVWLYLHLLFDLVFITGYAGLGFTLLRNQPFARRILLALIAADVAEDIVAALAFSRIIHHHSAVFAVTVLLHLATVAKWLTALILLTQAAFLAWDRGRAVIRRILMALWEQRFSAVVVAFLAILAIGRGPDVLELTSSTGLASRMPAIIGYGSRTSPASSANCRIGS